MKCKKCGNEILPDEKFCTNCSAPNIKTDKEPVPTEPGEEPVQSEPASGPALITAAETEIKNTSVPAAESVKKKPEKSSNLTYPASAKTKPVKTRPPAQQKNRRLADTLSAVSGGIVALALVVFLVFQVFEIYLFTFKNSGVELWQYEQKIITPIEVQSGSEDIVLGDLEEHGVSVYVPSQTFDDETTVVLSNPKRKPQIDAKSFVPLGSPISLDSKSQQKRLNRPVRVTISLDSLENVKDGSFYVADFNERNSWDYIVPDEVNLEKRTVTFTTHHLSTFGVVNLGREKNVEEFVRRKSIERWVKTNIQGETQQARDDVVTEIIQNRMGIKDAAVLEFVKSRVKEECPESLLSPYLSSSDSSRFTRTVAESVGRNIPKIMAPEELEKALEIVCEQPWAAESAPGAASSLSDGNLPEATVKVVDGIASGFVEDRVKNTWVDLVDRKAEVWNRAEIEKAYQVYKEGSDKTKPLWGYEVKAGNFEELWDQMKGVAEEITDEAVSSYCKVVNKKPGELLQEEKILIIEETKQGLKKQFENRLHQDAEIEKIKEENSSMMNMLNEKNLLKIGTDNPVFEEQDDLESLMDRIFVMVDRIKQDTGRFRIIYQVRTTETYGEGELKDMIYISDIAELVHVYYDKGEEDYLQKLIDTGLAPEVYVAEQEEPPVEEAVSISLDGRWEDDEGLGVEINGKTGVFYSFSPEWQGHADAGFISLGDLMLKDIEQISDTTKWGCSIIWREVLVDDNTPSGVVWSDSATITMYGNESFILILSKTTDPETGEVKEGGRNFHRVTDEKDLENTDDTRPPEIEHDMQEPDTTEPKEEGQSAVNMSLDGKWLTSDGMGVEITGTAGIFYSLKGWQTFIDAGLVKLGDLKIKDIIQTGDKKWKCLELWWFTDSDNKPHSVGWSDDGTITMSDDGKSFIIKSSSTHPVDGTKRTGETTYYRQ